MQSTARMASIVSLILAVRQPPDTNLYPNKMSTDRPIVILAPRMTDDSKAIWKTCLDLGWSTERMHGWRVPDHLATTDRRVIIYGEPLFAEAVCDQIGLVLLEPPIDWLTTVPFGYLSREVTLTTLGQARQIQGRAFVKPADGKIFDPKVYESGSDLPNDDQVDSDIGVLRSGVVDFRLEVRCFVRGKNIVTQSPYWRNNELASDLDGNWPFQGSEESEALAFAQKVLDDDRVVLPPACTLDVGRLLDGSWAIIEANPAWGAGLYGCDPKEVLLSIGDAIMKKSLVTEPDKRWISKRRHAVHL